MALRTGELISKLFKRALTCKQLTADEEIQFKQTLVNITSDIVKVCEKNNLVYFLAYGSALGAIRHNGFIPWDDDIDICMPRTDFSSFLRIFEKEKGDKYFIRCISKGDSLGVPTAHISLKGTRYVNYGDLTFTANEPEETRGIYVDIFPLDDAPDNIIFRKIHGARCLALLFIAGCVSIKEQVDYLKKKGVILSKEEKKQLRLKITLGKLFSYRDIVGWTEKYDKLAQKYHNDQSLYVTSYHGYRSFSKSVYLRSDLYPCIKGSFEGHSWNIPHNPDNYLTRIYDDYMIIPKEENRRIHPIIDLSFDTTDK